MRGDGKRVAKGETQRGEKSAHPRHKGEASCSPLWVSPLDRRANLVSKRNDDLTDGLAAGLLAICLTVK